MIIFSQEECWVLPRPLLRSLDSYSQQMPPRGDSCLSPSGVQIIEWNISVERGDVHAEWGQM